MVVDSSALVAALGDSGRDGTWAAEQMANTNLVAPELVMYETANVLRRLELTGDLPLEAAQHAYNDLLALRLTLWPYAHLAEAVWRLRRTITCYDAAYVALAQRLDAPLVTLDLRLARGSKAQCQVLTPL